MDHEQAVDAHFDSLPKSEQARARRAGFRPYRELARTQRTVMELDEAKADWRLRQETGEDATLRRQTFTREEVLAMLALLLDSIGSRRCAYLKGQTEVIRMGLGLESKHTMRGIARMLNLRAVSSVHEQVACFRRKWRKLHSDTGGRKGVQKESFSTPL